MRIGAELVQKQQEPQQTFKACYSRARARDKAGLWGLSHDFWGKWNSRLGGGTKSSVLPISYLLMKTGGGSFGPLSLLQAGQEDMQFQRQDGFGRAAERTTQ